jgi:predicted SAM-dependent methyltransferase
MTSKARQSRAAKLSFRQGSNPKRRHRREKTQGSKKQIRLDLGCGVRPKVGFEGVDKCAVNADWHVDLLQFPWPWGDGTVAELHSAHFLEHIPAECDDSGVDLLVRFMDEAWRVLKPGGKFTVIVPNARSNRAFQDPTHRRFFVAETFWYFNAEWRLQNGVEHCLGRCHFECEVTVSCSTAMSLLTDEERARRFEAHWNAIFDWRVLLVKRPHPTKGYNRH